MNIVRIIPKKTDKRKQLPARYRDLGAALLFVFLLPYVIAALWGHVGEQKELVSRKTLTENTEWIDEKYDVEVMGSFGIRHMTMGEYLMCKLYQIMPDSEDALLYETETMKAQAVLLRTQLWKLMLKEEEPIRIQEEELFYNREISLEELQTGRYKEAIRETDGLCLSYDNMPIQAAYFAVSNGQTRDAAGLWGEDSYPYLKSVSCSGDILSKDYQSVKNVSKNEFCKIAASLFSNEVSKENIWENLEFIYDEAGYVINVRYQEFVCSGETFRYAFGLSSAAFGVKWQQDEVIFTVKGVGHGFGMSQYGANRKALEGDLFDEILQYYFFQTELVKIE